MRGDTEGVSVVIICTCGDVLLTCNCCVIGSGIVSVLSRLAFFTFPSLFFLACLDRLTPFFIV